MDEKENKVMGEEMADGELVGQAEFGEPTEGVILEKQSDEFAEAENIDDAAEANEAEAILKAEAAAAPKKAFDWAKGMKILSWILLVLIAAYFIFNAWSYRTMSPIYIVLYIGFGIFYGCSVLFGMHILAAIAENTKKTSEYLEKLTALKEEELNR